MAADYSYLGLSENLFPADNEPNFISNTQLSQLIEDGGLSSSGVTSNLSGKSMTSASGVKFIDSKGLASTETFPGTTINGSPSVLTNSTSVPLAIPGLSMTLSATRSTRIFITYSATGFIDAPPNSTTAGQGLRVGLFINNVGSNVAPYAAPMTYSSGGFYYPAYSTVSYSAVHTLGTGTNVIDLRFWMEGGSSPVYVFPVATILTYTRLGA